MLQSIRDRTQGWIAGVIISILILSFALWGIHSYLGSNGNKTVVAKVDGTEITKNELSLAYERMQRQLQMQLSSGQSLPAQAESELKTRALQNLISIQVLSQASLNQNYRVSQNQLSSFLESLPEFQVNGQFSMERFRQVLQFTMYNPGDFLNLIKTSLLIDQPRLGLVLSSFVLPDEVKNSVALVNQERNFQYLALQPSVVANQTITIAPDRIQAYYQQHQDDFKTKEQMTVEYLLLSVNDVGKNIHASDEVLQKFYNENLSSFKKPFAQVKDQVKTHYATQQAQEAFATQREKLANITYEHPESLTAAAKELNLPIKTSEQFSKDKGGNDITASSKVRDIAFTADVLNAQNNSDVIQLNDNEVVVIRRKTYAPAELLPLKSVENQIIEKLKKVELEDRTNQLAKEIVSKLQAGANPEQMAKQYNLSWKQLGFVTRQTEKISPAILDTAFAMPAPSANKMSFSFVKLPEGGNAVVGLKAVKPGVFKGDQKQYQAYTQQIQTSQGLLEYELYKQSLINQAKIEVEN